MTTLIKISALLLVMTQVNASIANNASALSKATDPELRYWGAMYVENNGKFEEVKRIEIPASYFVHGVEGLNEDMSREVVNELFGIEDYMAAHHTESLTYRLLISAQDASMEGSEDICDVWVRSEDFLNYCFDGDGYGRAQCVDPNRAFYWGWCINITYNSVFSYCAGLCTTYQGLTGKPASRMALQLTPEDRASNPKLIRATPYAGGETCKLSSGTKALVLNSGKTAQGITRTNRSNKPVALCDTDCSTAPSWTLKMVDKDKPMEGFYISTKEGNATKYLSWDEKAGLTMATKPAAPTEAQKTAMTWHVGEGEFTDGAVTGYQILTKASLDNALVVDKETGEVAVEKVYTEEPKKEGILPRYLASPKYNTVWKFNDCKGGALTPANKTKKPKAKSSID